MRVEDQKAQRLERNDGPISDYCTYLPDIYITCHGQGFLLTWIVSICGMRGLLSTVFARVGSLLEKSVMESSSTSVLPAKRPRDHIPIHSPASANSKRFRNAIVLAPMVRSGTCELLSTSPEHYVFRNSMPSFGASSSILLTGHAT